MRPASDFVAGFVGADRAVKALSVTPLDLTSLEPYDGAIEASVPANADLSQVLAALLTSDGRVEVTATDGRRLGTLTPPLLLAQARRAREHLEGSPG